LNGQKLDPEGPAMPCGLVAKSFFNDRYSLLLNGDSKPITINEKGIAWESDKEYKFKNMEGTKDGKDYKSF
jgi:hypothetical protein